MFAVTGVSVHKTCQIKKKCLAKTEFCQSSQFDNQLKPIKVPIEHKKLIFDKNPNCQKSISQAEPYKWLSFIHCLLSFYL